MRDAASNVRPCRGALRGDELGDVVEGEDGAVIFFIRALICDADGEGALLPADVEGDLLQGARFQRVLVMFVEHGAEIDAADEMMQLTLYIASKALFDHDIEGDSDAVSRNVTHLLEYFTRLVSPFFSLLLKLPLPSTLRFRKAVRDLDAVIYRMIEQRRAAGGSGDDLLARLMRAKDDETQAQMTESQLRDELLTLLIAGQADRIVDPNEAREAAQDLPNGQFLMLPNCGHAPQMEKAWTINRLVVHYLATPKPTPQPRFHQLLLAKPNTVL